MQNNTVTSNYLPIQNDDLVNKDYLFNIKLPVNGGVVISAAVLCFSLQQWKRGGYKRKINEN
jgi:hypothetical protein